MPRAAGDEFPGPPMAMALLDETPVLGFNNNTLGIVVTRFANGRFDEPFTAIGRPEAISLALGRTGSGAAGFIAGQANDGRLIVERLLFP